MKNEDREIKEIERDAIKYMLFAVALIGIMISSVFVSNWGYQQSLAQQNRTTSISCDSYMFGVCATWRITSHSDPKFGNTICTNYPIGNWCEWKP